VLTALKEGAHSRVALRKNTIESHIGLSAEGELMLEGMIGFLKNNVFQERRVRNRTLMLEQISTACLDLL